MASAISIAALCLLLVGCSTGLVCRSGFNTSVYNIPIQFWNDTTCSSANQQSCFIGELTYTISDFGEIELVYGSCVSRQYESLLECDSIFGEGGIEPDTLLAILPNLQDQLETAIAEFSDDTAQSIVNYLQDVGSDLNDVEIIYSILNGAGVSFPSELRYSMKKLDALLLTLILNQTGAGAALDEFFYSFSALNTNDPASSKLLYEFFEGLNITVPAQARPLIENLPALISQNFEGDETFAMVNETLFSVLGGFSPSAQSSSLSQSDIDSILQVIPEEYNLAPFFNTLPKLVSEMQNQNFEYAQVWSLELLKSYSRITEATEALSNATLKLLEGLNVSLTDDLITMIRYQPGQIYQFFPNNTVLIDQILNGIAKGLASAGGTNEFDLEGILSMLMVPDFAGRQEIVAFLEGLSQRLVAVDFDGAGQFALEALKNISVPSVESQLLSQSIIDFADRMNLTLSSEIEEVITYFPGLFLAIFSNETDLINQIYTNISQGLDDSDFNPDFSPSESNTSPVESLTAIIDAIKPMIPPALNFSFPILDSIPELLNQLSMNNSAYLNTWQIEIVKSYSVITPATEALTNATFDMLKRFKVYNYLPEETIMILMYQPGMYYMFFEDSAMLDYVFYNMSAVINSIGVPELDLEQLLGMANFPPFPGMGQITDILEKFNDIALTGNVTNMAIFALEALKNVSVVTTESTALSEAMIRFLAQMNITLATEVQELIRYIPGILNIALPNNTALVNTIFANITQGLTDVNIDDPLSMLKSNLEQLLATNVLPSEYSALLSRLPDLISAIVANDTSQVLSWIIGVSEISLPNTTAAQALTYALRSLTSQIKGAAGDPFLDLGLEYLPRIAYALFPNESSLIDIIFNNITEGLVNVNLTHPNPSQLEDSLRYVDLSMVPAEMLPLLNYTQDLIAALLQNNTSMIQKIVIAMQSQYCTSSDITENFATAIMDELSRRGLTLQDEYRLVFECLPALTFAALPNDTEIITTVFTQMIASFTNYTAYIEGLLASYGVTLPPDTTKLLGVWPDIESALTRGNFTEALMLLQRYTDETTRDTELSRLIITIATKLGASLTEEQVIYVKQSAMRFYNDGLANYTAMLDAIFSSLNADIAAGKDLGIAIKDALSGAGVVIPPRAVPVLDNIQPTIDAVNATIHGDGNALNLAALKLLEDYNQSFPSAQIQLQIYQQKLQISLQAGLSNTQNPTIPDEAFESMDNIYRLMLEMSNVTEVQFKAMLIERFPNMEGAIEILFNFQPKEVFSLATQLATWVADPERDSSILAGYINSTIYLLLDRSNIDLSALLKTLPNPTYCKYETCLTDGCNVKNLLPAEIPTEPPNATLSTSDAPTTTSTTIATTTTATTTTSAAGGITQKNVISTALFTSAAWFLSMILL